MTTADLYPGFASHWIETSQCKIFARSSGKGPPLLLIHGFPQTNVMWHRIAPALAEHFTLIIPDLPGYGWSGAPEADETHAPYTKRAMAAVLVEAMESLGHVHFRCVGHDRGARVGARMALDHPGRLHSLAVLDIVPTHEMWRTMDAKRAMKVYHWTFLAQPAPMPEKLIAADPEMWLDHTIASWTLAGDLSAFDARVMAHYRAFFRDPSRIHATCEDYRAGATTDLALDEADFAAGRRIEVPLFALWGEKGIPAEGASPLDVWKQWGRDVSGAGIASGHFVAEENPGATLAALLPFLKRA